MRKGRDGEKREKREKNPGKNKKREKTDDYSGHYVIARSRPPERRPLERRTLAPITELYSRGLHCLHYLLLRVSQCGFRSEDEELLFHFTEYLLR